MRYTTMDTFIMSTAGCDGTAPDSLESILAGSEAGAGGCCITADLTADGIAVLCSCGGYPVPEGFLGLKEHTYFELRSALPKIVTVGQAVELAKCCAGKMAVSLGSAAACAAVRIALSTADMLDNAFITGLGMAEGARLAARFPTLHVMGDLPDVPVSPAATARAARDTGLFGLRAAPGHLTPELVRECRELGLFTASRESSSIDVLERLIGLRVNFIETARPDRAYSFLPARPARKPAGAD
ncbi:MAG: hypothetical protein HFH27_10970 [Clostridiaceae bacterium]|nr:hypothetical protein [Clostridiaceae bacterium]NBI83725.1 hypothetical protein [Clostridiaceae bacterium]